MASHRIVKRYINKMEVSGNDFNTLYIKRNSKTVSIACRIFQSIKQVTRKFLGEALKMQGVS